MDDADEERIPITEWPVETHSHNNFTSNEDCTEQTFDLLRHKAHGGSRSRSSLPRYTIRNEQQSPPQCKKHKLDASTEGTILAEAGPEIKRGGSGEDSGLKMNATGTLDENEPLAQARVARWWRRNRHVQSSTLPVTGNPNTLLYHVSRNEVCRAYLSEEKKRLIKKTLVFKEKADVHAAIASIDDWMGNYTAGLERILQAIKFEPENSEYTWLKEKLQRQCNILKIQENKMELTKTCDKAFPSVVEVERVSAKNLSVEEFTDSYVKQKKPVILLDAVAEMTSTKWDLEFVKSRAGSVKVMVKHAVPQSVEWAKLEESREITVGEFISQVEENKTDEYLFDWSLPLHCPSLARDLTLPKYFRGNYLQNTAPGSLYHDSWPSLFIAPKGAVSNLHVDAFASSFWMALFQGEKRWTFFDAEDVPLLYAKYIHSMDPVFSVDLSSPDLQQFPLLALTTPKQCVLKPGELLFVPAGSPHYVENLTTTLAVSSNHVDHSNHKQVCDELRINGLLDPRAADLLQQLENPKVSQMQERSHHSDDGVRSLEYC